ncbi:MAG: mechanosensitive ion channel, partial [Desulfovibrio sp.]
GKIKKITMRATVVETYDSATIYVPNSEFMSGHLTNWTSNNRTRRMALKIGVAYGSDTNKVIKLLKDCAQKNDGILAFPEPSVVFTDFGNNTLDFTLYYWLKDFSLIQSAASNLRLAINEAFAKEHIEIAFPQLDVHVKDMPPKSVQYHAANPDSQSRRSPLALSRRIRRRTSSLPAPGTPQPRPAAK